MTTVVTAKGTDIVLARSSNTVQVEGNPYFPQEDVTMDALTSSTTTSTCAWKGKAAYHNLSKDGQSVPDIAWSYPDAKPAAANIKGYLAFYKNKVDIKTIQ